MYHFATQRAHNVLRNIWQGACNSSVCILAPQDVKEDTSLLSDDDDDDEMEDLDALARGMDRGRTASSPTAASAAETTKNAGIVAQGVLTERISIAWTAYKQ